MTELPDYLPQKFDLEDHSLSMFFAEIAIDLDNLSKEERLDKIDYNKIDLELERVIVHMTPHSFFF